MLSIPCYSYVLLGVNLQPQMILLRSTFQPNASSFASCVPAGHLLCYFCFYILFQNCFIFYFFSFQLLICLCALDTNLLARIFFEMPFFVCILFWASFLSKISFDLFLSDLLSDLFLLWCIVRFVCSCLFGIFSFRWFLYFSLSLEVSLVYRAS